MKEILFKGKRKDNGQWIYGVPCSFIGLGGTWCDCIMQETEGYHSVKEIYDIIPETLGQYTGLMDDNGAKIFVGDIVKSHSGLTGKVAFGQYFDDEYRCDFYGYAWIKISKDDFEDCDISPYTLMIDKYWSGHKVIGNIHDT